MGLIGRLVGLSFKLTLITGVLLGGLTLLPDHLFGEEKFDPQSKVPVVTELPTNVKIIRPTLNDIKKLELEQDVPEPESIKIHKGFIYTGTVNGQILKIDEKTKKVTVLTTLVDKEAKNCEQVKTAKESCGRPLDLEIVGDVLYAVDAFRGFIEYDLIKNTKISYDLSNKIPGYETNEKLFNSIRQDPLNANIIYLSVSSTKYNFEKISLTFLEYESSSILIAVNKATKKVTVIGKDFVMGNGLEISGDKKSLFINDLCNQRILKYDLKEIDTFLKIGKGSLPKWTVFRDRIPGLPDNLTKHGKNIIAALFQYKPDNPIFDQLEANAHLRKLLYRLFYVGSELLKLMKKYYSCSCVDELQHSLETGLIITKLFSYNSGIAILDQTTGAINTLILLPIEFITHAIYNPATGNLYFGSIVHKQIHTMAIKL